MPFDVDSPTYVAIRFLQFATMTLLIGCVAFRIAVLPRFSRGVTNGDALAARIESRVVRWLNPILLVLSLAQVARLAAQHRVYFEDGAWSMGTMRPLLWQSGWGLAWLVAAGSIVVAFIAVRLLDRAPRVGWWLLGAVVGVLSWTMAMSGHPAAAESPRVAMLIDFLHVIAAGGWVGSLSVMMFIAVPAVLHDGVPDAHERIARLAAAFSPTALAFAAVLGVTGVTAGWRNVGSWSGLFHSRYGALLLSKLALVTLIAALGAINWKRVLPILGQPGATRALRRGAGIEMATAVVALLVTALLVATALPAM